MRYYEEIREYEPEEEVCRGLNRGCGGTRRDHCPDDDRHRADRRQGRHHRAAGRGRHDDREQHDPHGDPGESEETLVGFNAHRVAKLGCCDGVAADDLESSPRFIAAGSEMRGLRITHATRTATTIPMTLGPHWMKVLKNRARSSGMNRAGKTPAMKNTKA